MRRLRYHSCVEEPGGREAGLEGVCAYEADRNANTALHCAAMAGHTPICERLLTGRDKEGAQKDPRLLKFAETIYNRLASN